MNAKVKETLYQENLDIVNLSRDDLEMVAGGKSSIKKSVALILALLSLGSGTTLLHENLDFSLKASALFGRRNFKMQSPLKLEKMIEFVRNDPFYRARLQARGVDIDNPQTFRTWWQANGANWWKDTTNTGGNVSGQHAPEEAGFDIGAAIRIGRQRQDSKQQPVLVHNELLAADRLLISYFNFTLEQNGVIEMGLDNDVVELIKSPKFKKIVDNNFGIFTVNEETDSFLGVPMGEARLTQVNAHKRLMTLAKKRGTEARILERQLMISQLQRNAYPLMLSAFAFFGTGSIAKIKNILVSLGMWGKVGVMKAYNRFIYNTLTLKKDPVELNKWIGEYLEANVFRQHAAMCRIVQIMSGMADLWATSDKTGVPCTSACTMTFMGDSGVGKTYTARMLSQALFHKDMQPWQFITSTSVTASSISSAKVQDSAKSEKKLSPADQLFNENSEIVRQLKLNNRIIIVLDEIDKMHKADPNDTILERLRDARDTGKLLVRKGINYEYIDVSRTVFICITNELRECWGLPKVDLTEAQAASRTDIKRDRSLTNRFDVIEFNYFKSEDYQFILKPQLDELKTEYLESYKMDIDISDELIKSICDAAEIKNKGVRGVNDFLVLLRGKLVGYRSKNKQQLAEKSEPKKIIVKYLAENNSFKIS